MRRWINGQSPDLGPKILWIKLDWFKGTLTGKPSQFDAENPANSGEDLLKRWFFHHFFSGELTLSAGVWSPKNAASSRFRVPSPLASQVPHSVAKMATDSKAFVTWRIFQR